jgi:glycosyltransferase involved in cell wall biosynthesis
LCGKEVPSVTDDDRRASLDLSVVVPLFDEEDNLPILVREIREALETTELSYELICVDDGSRDRSWEILQSLAREDNAISAIRFRRNFGQTAALQAGLDAARGAVVVTLDADLQNDPADIPRMVARLDEGYDLVAGWRADRKDTFLSRRLPSALANALIRAITGVRLHDYGCTLKAMRRVVAKDLRLYGEMHRFIPAIASWSGASISEMKVNHRVRRFGRTKYGIGRTLRVVLDLLTVRFLQSFLVRPMQAFGLWGLVIGAVGFGIAGWLTLERVLWGVPLANRPLMLLGILLILFGFQLLCSGLVADLLTRTYHESQGRKTYFIRERVDGEEGGEPPV